MYVFKISEPDGYLLPGVEGTMIRFFTILFSITNMRKYLLLAGVVLLVATAGCLGGDSGADGENGMDDANMTDGGNTTDGTPDDANGDGATTVEADTVTEEMLAALDDAAAHSFFMNQTVQSEAVESGTNLSLAEVRVSISRGLVDLDDNELRVNTTVQSPTNEGVDERGEIYIVDGVEYLGRLTQNGTRWVTLTNETVQRSLSIYSRLGILTERLQNATVEYVRTEEVNGTEAHLLEADPSNPNDYINDIVENNSVINVEATNVSLRLWVSTETDLPVRIQETIESRTTDRRAVIDQPEAQFAFTTRYDAYNYTDEDISIDVPEDAQS